MENISIKGHVQIFDENNNLVTEEDNMVVASGRNAVRRAFILGERFTFSRILLGEDGNVTTPETEITKVDERKKAEFTGVKIKNETLDDINKPLELEVSFSKATYAEYMNCKELSLTICKADDKGNIVYKNNTTEPEGEVLFSRVVFSGYPFTKDHTYTMKYSIYF